MIADISIIMTFHHEGLLAHYSLLGLERVRCAADRYNLSTELICVLDRANEDTFRIVSNHPFLRQQDQIIEVDIGDPASARNQGIKIATSEFIAIIDGDDYYSEDWLVRAQQALTQCIEPAVCHPEWVISFGEIHCALRLPDQRFEPYSYDSLLKHHPWVVTSFGLRSTYLDIPYTPVFSNSSGFGYEDWHWNLELIHEGYLHITAPETALYYRRKKNSVLVSHNQSHTIIRPCSFFDGNRIQLRGNAGQ